MDKDEESAKWAVAYTFQAVTRHNPDRMKNHAAQAMPIAFLAMHEAKSEDNADILDVWDEVWTDGTPGTESGIKLYMKEIVALLSSALESTQWKMKAQSSKAMGAIGSKLKSQIPVKEQGTLLVQLIEALAGRTWTGKESILIAIKDLIEANPENVSNMLVDANNPLTEDILIKCLLRECGKERIEYKIVAIDTTSTILRCLDLDYFESLYTMLIPFIRKALDDEKSDKKVEEDEVETYSLDLQMAVVKSLGQAWPESPDTQHKFVDEFLSVLNAMIQNTTRKLQMAITTTLGLVISSYNTKADLDAIVFDKASNILAFGLSMPKNSQLRGEALNVLDQTLDVLSQSSASTEKEEFYAKVNKSLDDVIKDLATDAALKDKARKMKARLTNMSEAPMDCD